jgi:poly-gamma-glutamate synthesis protein (capsule biosynthesis protein)
VVTIANNHANDVGEAGVRETPRHLARLGITALGAARAAPPWVRVETVEVRGWRIGFVAATTFLNDDQRGDAPRIPKLPTARLASTIVPLVEAARGTHDLVIVVLHWGRELDDEPGAAQVAAARAMIDAGADAVIGHHPHVLQRIERYRRGVIAYSLGNFVFRNTRLPLRLTGVLRLGFDRDRGCLDELAFHPAVMNSHGAAHPEPARRATTSSFDDVADRVIGLSAPTRWSVDGDRLVAPAVCDAP